MTALTLFDIPTKEPRTSWSYNPWKIRLALNFKGIEYQTKWVEYPDLEPTLSSHVPPNPPSQASYTSPSVQFPDGSYMMDSKSIVKVIEKEHPEPSLHLDSPLLAKIEELVPKLNEPLRNYWMPLVATKLLSERSTEYFLAVKLKKVGKTVEQMREEFGDGEAVWAKVLPTISELGDLLESNGGPFLMGETPSYADFMVVSVLQYYKTVDEALFLKVVGGPGDTQTPLRRLYDASKPWVARNDH